jgi:hypothetical protein
MQEAIFEQRWRNHSAPEVQRRDLLRRVFTASGNDRTESNQKNVTTFEEGTCFGLRIVVSGASIVV